jgi:hypothetical protein
VQAKYDRLRTNLNDTFAKSTVELELICNMFDRISQEFDGHEGIMQEMLCKVEEMDHKSEDEPANEMPLALL